MKNLAKKFLFCIIIIFFMIDSNETVFAKELNVSNDNFWRDTEGNYIYSQGGGVFFFENKYYWYGVKYQGAVTYANSPYKKNNDTSFVAVSCYSSTDLVNWTHENDILTCNTVGLEGCEWLGRLGVAYNSNTHKYVLLTQFVGTNGTGVLFATGDTPTANFTYDHIQSEVEILNGSSVVTGDQTIFIDDDGKAYLVFSNSGGRGNTYVAALRESDYLSIEQGVCVARNSEGREGNCMFKYNGKYYICSSDLHGWNASTTHYIYSDNIQGTYSSDTVMNGSQNDYSHVSQSGFFITIKGTEKTTVIYCGDRWSDFAGNGLGYNQWVPISFDGDIPYFNSLSEWSIDSVTGNWSIESGNNYVMNPSFEADRVSSSELTGWSYWYNDSSLKDSISNLDKGMTGKWCLNFYNQNAYNVSTYQNIAVPNGTYMLSAYVRSSGGQNAATLYAKNMGTSGKQVDLSRTISSWTEVTIDDIVVTNGRIQIGIWSDSNAGNWIRVDDVSLIKVN